MTIFFDEKMKKKRRVKYDDIFIFVSMVFLVSLFIFYSFRFVYFFSTERKKAKQGDNISFSEYLINNDSKLTKDGNKYIYMGKDVNNYVFYSGIMFRIVSIENGNIKLVTDENMTSLVMTYDNTSFDKTYVNNWLNEVEDDLNSGIFASLLDDKSKYLVNTKTCVDTLDNYDTTKCKKYNNDYLVGLLSIDEYMNALANNSYLNNGLYYWLSNNDLNGNFWYVYDLGGVSNKSKTEVNYYSYGVRPTITLAKDVSLISGTGTKEDPYIFYQNTNKLLVNRNAGEYLNFGGYKWRIMGHDKDNNVKLVLATNLEETGKYSSKDSSYLNTHYYTYLNNTFYNSLKNKEMVINHTWYNGMYNDDTLYDYKKIYTDEVDAKVGILNIGDLFLYDTDNSFLMTRSGNDMEYSIQNKKIFVDLVSNELGIRPVIYLDGKVNVTGLGTFNEPFEIEGE